MSRTKKLWSFWVAVIALNLLPLTAAWAGDGHLPKDLKKIESRIFRSETAQDLYSGLSSLVEWAEQNCKSSSGGSNNGKACASPYFGYVDEVIDGLGQQAELIRGKLSKYKDRGNDLTARTKAQLEYARETKRISAVLSSLGSNRNTKNLLEKLNLAKDTAQLSIIKDLEESISSAQSEVNSPKDVYSVIFRMQGWVKANCNVDAGSSKKKCPSEYSKGLLAATTALHKKAGTFGADLIHGGVMTQIAAHLDPNTIGNNEVALKESVDKVSDEAQKMESEVAKNSEVEKLVSEFNPKSSGQQSPFDALKYRNQPDRLYSLLVEVAHWAGKHCNVSGGGSVPGCSQGDKDKIAAVLKPIAARAKNFEKDDIHGPILEAVLKELGDIDNLKEAEARERLEKARKALITAKLNSLLDESSEDLAQQKDNPGEYLRSKLAVLLKYSEELCSLNAYRKCSLPDYKDHIQPAIEHFQDKVSSLGRRKGLKPQEQQALKRSKDALRGIDIDNFKDKLDEVLGDVPRQPLAIEDDRDESSETAQSFQPVQAQESSKPTPSDGPDSHEHLLKKLKAQLGDGSSPEVDLGSLIAQHLNGESIEHLFSDDDLSSDEQNTPPAQGKKSKKNKKDKGDKQSKGKGKSKAKKKKGKRSGEADEESSEGKIDIHSDDLTPEALEKYFLGFKAKIDPSTKSAALFGQIPRECAEHFVFKKILNNRIKGCENSVGFQIVDEDSKGRTCIEKIWKDDNQVCNKQHPCVSISTLTNKGSTKFSLPANKDLSLRLFYRDAGKDENDDESQVCANFPNSPNTYYETPATKKANALAEKRLQEQLQNQFLLRRITCQRSADEIENVSRPAVELAADLGLISDSEAELHHKQLNTRQFQYLINEIPLASKDRLMEIRDKLGEWALTHSGDKDKVNEAFRHIIQLFVANKDFDEATVTIAVARSVGQSPEIERTLNNYETEIDVSQMHALAQNGFMGNTALLSRYNPLMQKLQKNTWNSCRSMNSQYMESCMHSMTALQNAAMIPMEARQADQQKWMFAAQMQGMMQQAMMGGGSYGMNSMGMGSMGMGMNHMNPMMGGINPMGMGMNPMMGMGSMGMGMNHMMGMNPMMGMGSMGMGMGMNPMGMMRF